MYECGALNEYSVACERHAINLYRQIRNRKGDCKNVARNTGFSIEVITIVKNYLFYDKHMLSDGYMRFHHDYYIAESWRRLAEANGNNIRECDIIMLRHEILEIRYILDGYNQSEAHDLANQLYRYSDYCRNRR